MSGIVPLLKRVPLFGDLTESDLATLACACHLRRVNAGSILFQRGDPGEAAYIVRSGSIAILVSAHDGRELVINQLQAGEWFGELALLTGKPRSATALASTPTEIVVLPRDEFMTLLERQPQLMRHLLASLAERLAATTDLQSELAFLDAAARLARTLLTLEQEQPVPGVVRISHEAIAQRMGVTRQTVTKILGRWRRAGWIASRRHHITLRDRQALRECAGETAI